MDRSTTIKMHADTSDHPCARKIATRTKVRKHTPRYAGPAFDPSLVSRTLSPVPPEVLS